MQKDTNMMPRAQRRDNKPINTSYSQIFKFTLEQAMKAQKGRRSIALLFL
jgi:hypothetical protein